MEFKFNYNYPDEGPIDIQMITPIYYTNICFNIGNICVKYFSEWKNTNNIVGIVNTVFDLLAEENPGNGYHGHNIVKAKQYKNSYVYEKQNYDWNNE